MTDRQPSSGDGPDVVVIGGGPAGSTAATLIAQRGYRVQLFERERFPRFHIGESLIPETYWVLERLNMLPKMKASHFVQKHSVQFVNASGKQSAPFYFWDNKPHECSQTWQVVRSEFDMMMLNNAREHGVEAHEGVRVRDIILEGRPGRGSEDSRSRTEPFAKSRAKVVVDASGQSGLLMNKFKLRIWDPDLEQGSGVDLLGRSLSRYGPRRRRDHGAANREPQGLVLVHPAARQSSQRRESSPRSITCSRGAAATNKSIPRRSSAVRPSGTESRSGKRITGYFATRDYSYRAEKVAGDGWVMIGDAFGFLDPLYSSGVLLALRSGEMAADAIVEGLQSGDLSAAQLGKWGPTLNQGIDRMRRLVCEYYEGFSFGNFVRQHPHLKGTITDLLIGDLFTDKVDVVWEPMESLYVEGKQKPNTWDSGTDPEVAANKLNELYLPEGMRP